MMSGTERNSNMSKASYPLAVERKEDRFEVDTLGFNILFDLASSDELSTLSEVDLLSCVSLASSFFSDTSSILRGSTGVGWSFFFFLKIELSEFIIDFFRFSGFLGSCCWISLKSAN